MKSLSWNSFHHSFSSGYYIGSFQDRQTDANFTLFFVMTQKPTLAILLGHPLLPLIILTGLGFFPFLTISDALASASLEAQISRNFGSWTSFELLKYQGCGVSVSAVF